MRPHVLGQVAGIGERLAARLADMRLLPRMHPHVPGQVAGRRTRLAARLADMRLFPRMHPHVLIQVFRPRERLATRLADMRYARRLSISNVRFSAITTKAFSIGISSVLWHGINTAVENGLFVDHSH
jgi:hypothetical protein